MESSNTRSVKIAQDERGGWSSDRPRREGAPPRPVDVSVRSRVLSPSDALRYSPGSLLVIVSASKAERDRFTERLIENKNALFSLDKVRGLLAGRVPEDEVDARGSELILAAARKRLEAGDTVVIAAETLDPEERERYVRIAHEFRRPRHLILLESKDEVPEESRAELASLRRRLVNSELGQEGFQTALRLSGDTIGEVKRLVFRPAPRDD
jgi:predicted kinase